MADILKWNLGLVNPTAEQLGTACVIIEETAYPIGSRYAAVSYQVRVQHLEWVGYGGGVIIDPICVIYDLETGDAVPFSEIFSQPYSGEWQPDTGTQKFPDNGKLGDPVLIKNGTDPGTMYLTFELSPGERYTMEIRHDTLRILDAS